MLSPRNSTIVNLQLIRFLAVGAANTLIGLALIYIAKFLGFGDVAANAIGYGLCIGLSFLLNKRWTFGHRGSVGSAFMRFALVTAIAYLANLAVVMFAIHIVALNHYLAQALGIPVYTALSYLGSRMYAFAAVPSANDAAGHLPK